MKAIALTLLLFFSFGCQTFSHKPYESDFQKIEKLAMGSSRQEVVRVLGVPSEIEHAEGSTVLTYTIKYKSIAIPKLIVWLDADDKLTAKQINLFEETNDAMTKDQAKSHFSQANFVIHNSPEFGKGHYIPSDKLLIDDSKGLVLQFNTARNNAVRYISWQDTSENPSRSPSHRE